METYLPLTPPQNETYRFIEKYIRENNGTPPTPRKVADAFGISEQAAVTRINRIIERGWAQKTRGRKFSLRLLDPRRAAAA